MLEITRYRLLPSVEVEAFRAADSALQEWYYGQPGCRRRETMTNADGWWVTLVWWPDEHGAPAPGAHPLVSGENPTSPFVDEQTVTSAYYDR